MSQPHQCPQCTAELPANAPEGLCPKCLMQAAIYAGVESQMNGASPSGAETLPPDSDDSGKRQPTGSTPAKNWFGAPQPAELAEHFPRLEIIELLGEGGMGAVYKARQRDLDRLVALKILPPKFGDDQSFADRFAREARALAKLNHPNIVTVYEFGNADGLFYFMMEFVDGINLRQSLLSGGLSPQEALTIVPQICEALQFAHEEGVVHRDIKPENILLDKRGRVKIADFGLAKLFGAATAERQLTISHQMMGTLHYMAPEQMQRPLEVDHRADIYSLGVVIYELLTGELPLGRFEPPSKRAAVNAGLDDVVMRALEQEPARRYQHVSEVKTDIETVSKLGQFSDRQPQQEKGRAEQAAWQPTPRFDDEDLETARRQVQGPGMGLIIAGVFNLLPLVLAIVVGVVSLILRVPMHSEARPNPQIPVLNLTAFVAPLGGNMFPVAMLDSPDVSSALPIAVVGMPGVAEIVVILLMFGLNLPAGLVMILGGMKMRKLDTYGMAMTASIFALLPCTTGFMISLPIGIWSLIVLNRPDVKAAFGMLASFPSAGRQRMPAVAGKPLADMDVTSALRQVRGPAIGLGIVALMTVLPIILAIVILLVRFLNISI